MHASLRVTSRGNALVHEFQEAGTPLDPAKYDHPVTMLFVEETSSLWFTIATQGIGRA